MVPGQNVPVAAVDAPGVMSQEPFECDIPSGIATFVGREGALVSQMLTCLYNAQTVIPSSRIAVTPVFLRATAGMRVLAQNNATAANAILAACIKAIHSAGFDPSHSSAEIMSGANEGAFGWLTVNYVLGNLAAVMHQAVIDPAHVGAVTSVGALDLGGASTQVTVSILACE